MHDGLNVGPIHIVAGVSLTRISVCIGLISFSEVLMVSKRGLRSPEIEGVSDRSIE